MASTRIRAQFHLPARAHKCPGRNLSSRPRAVFHAPRKIVISMLSYCWHQTLSTHPGECPSVAPEGAARPNLPPCRLSSHEGELIETLFHDAGPLLVESAPVFTAILASIVAQSTRMRHRKNSLHPKSCRLWYHVRETHPRPLGLGAKLSTMMT